MMVKNIVAGLLSLLITNAAQHCHLHIVAAGNTHTCALLQDGLKCWGDSNFVYLGFTADGDIGNDAEEMGYGLPWVDLGTDLTPIQLSLGKHHSCALLNTGALKCWGFNFVGQIGQGDIFSIGGDTGELATMPPIDLGINGKAIQVCAGESHSCALLEDGGVKCWGQKDTEYIGNNANEMGDFLPRVNLGVNGKQISCGTEVSCALLEDSAVKCWGKRLHGALGQGPSDDIAEDEVEDFPPIDFGTNYSVDHVTCGSKFACVLLKSQRVKCWGVNFYGQLGMGDTNDRGSQTSGMGDALPHVDLGDQKVESIHCGYEHCCALFASKMMKCWGANNHGQLGQEHIENIGDDMNEMGNNLPYIDLGKNTFVESFSTGYYHTCAILNTKNLKCWGTNVNSQVGMDSSGLAIGASSGSMGDSLPVVNVNSFEQVGHSNCSTYTCSAGKTSDSSVNFSECYQCPSDMYSKAGSNCQECPHGYMIALNQSGCDICPVGMFSNDTIDCYNCKPGYHSLIAGSKECLPCISGFSSTEGASSCTCCESARYGSEGSCFDCEAGRFTNACGSSICELCPSGTWSLTAFSQCVSCSNGTYSSKEGASSPETCQPCPDGASCPEESSRLFVQPGFWRDQNDNFSISKCVPEEACSSSGFGQTVCSDGYTDERCGECTSNYFRQGQYCIECSSSIFTWAVIIILFILVTFLSYHAIISTKFKHIRRSLRIVVVSIQIMAGFVTLSINWPMEMQTFFTVLSVSNLSVDLIGVECALTIDYWTKWKMLQLMPLYIAIAFVIIYIILVVVFKNPANRSTRWNIFKAYAVVILTLYTSLVTKAVEPLICIEVDNSGNPVMVYNSIEPCDSVYYESQLKYVLLSMLVYCVMLPVLLVLFLIIKRNKFKDSTYRQKHGYLTDSYTAKCYYWEVLLVLKRIIMALIADLTNSTVLNAFSGVVCLIVYGLLISKYNPYNQDHTNFFEQIWSAVLVMVLVSLLVYENGEDAVGLSIFLISFTSICFLYCCCVGISRMIDSRSLMYGRKELFSLKP